MTRRLNLRIVLAIAALVGLGTVISADTPAFAREPAVYTGIVRGTAIGGYDAVAYFTDGKATAGKTEFTWTHDGATWRFSSEANRDAFIADPGKYAPQYGGYCAWAVSHGYTAKGDPAAWTISDGKLYLNYNKSVRKDWEKDIAGNVRKGDANWPRVLGQ